MPLIADAAPVYADACSTPDKVLRPEDSLSGLTKHLELLLDGSAEEFMHSLITFLNSDEACRPVGRQRSSRATRPISPHEVQCIPESSLS